MVGVDPITGAVEPLFDPRRQPWDEHFEFDLVSGKIVGRTPAGRGTVERLGMNRRQALDARLLWMALGLFP